jgi:hypothetical protein
MRENSGHKCNTPVVLSHPDFTVGYRIALYQAGRICSRRRGLSPPVGNPLPEHRQSHHALRTEIELSKPREEFNTIYTQYSGNRRKETEFRRCGRVLK